MTSVGRWAPAGVVMLCSLLAAQDVSAWGDTRPQIMCEIAFQELNPQARARVIRLLRQDPDFQRFSKACIWPDHPRTRARVEYPRVVYTDLDTSFCKIPLMSPPRVPYSRIIGSPGWL